MDVNDKKRFAEIMTGLAEDCSAQMTRPGLAMRFDALKQYSIEQVHTAVISVMKKNVYTKMPTTGTIIQAIEGTEDDRAELQITAIRKEISRIGRDGAPRFEDGITAHLIRHRFGWSAVCAMTIKELEFFAKEFKSAYSAHSRVETNAMLENTVITKPVLELLKNIGNGT